MYFYPQLTEDDEVEAIWFKHFPKHVKIQAFEEKFDTHLGKD